MSEWRESVTRAKAIRMLAALATALGAAAVASGCSKQPGASNYPLAGLVYDTNGGTLADTDAASPTFGARLDISQQALGSSQPMLLNPSGPIAAPSGFVQVGQCVRIGPAAFGFPVISRLKVPVDTTRLPPGATPSQVCVLYSDTYFSPPLPLSAQTPHAFYIAPVTSDSTSVSVLVLQTGLYEAVIPPTPPPTITSVSPSDGLLSGGITVTLTGTGFEPNAKVTVNGIPQDNVQVLSPTQITYTNTPQPVISADVRVQNPDGGRGEAFSAFSYHNASAVTPAIAAIKISPSTANVARGLAQQFSATATDQSGNPIAAVFSWSSSGGPVDVTGLFTANSEAAGSFTVTATSGGVTGHASVTVH